MLKNQRQVIFGIKGRVHLKTLWSHPQVPYPIHPEPPDFLPLVAPADDIGIRTPVNVQQIGV
jgi:hypothetical protein